MTEWENTGREFTVEARTPEFGGTLPSVRAAFTLRQVARYNSFEDLTAQYARVQGEDVAKALSRETDSERLNLLEQLADAAVRSADRSRISLLARVAANVMNGDDAVIQKTAVILSTLLMLHPVHVSMLVTLKQRENARIGGQPRPLRAVSEDEDTLRVLITQLEAMGLLIDLNQKSVFTLHEQNPQVTPFGKAILDYLVDVKAVPREDLDPGSPK